MLEQRDNVPCIPCEVISQHTKALRGMEYFDILLWNHERAQLLILLVQHGVL